MHSAEGGNMSEKRNDLPLGTRSRIVQRLTQA
jgi:hypothetical protein